VDPIKGTRYNSDKILEYIQQFQRLNGGISPSFQEIIDALGISSKSVVRYHLDSLVDARKIKLVFTKGKRPRVRGIIINKE
jgi:hypothetical protein